jgi:hypothetical protein
VCSPGRSRHERYPEELPALAELLAQITTTRSWPLSPLIAAPALRLIEDARARLSPACRRPVSPTV